MNPRHSYDRSDRIDAVVFRWLLVAAVLFALFNGVRAYQHFDNWKWMVEESR